MASASRFDTIRGGRRAPRRLAIAALGAASLLALGAGLAPPGPLWSWVYLVVVTLFPVLLVALALERRFAGSRRLGAVILGLGLLLGGSAAAIRWLDDRPDTLWISGLPASAWVLLLGLVLLPLLLVGLGHALTFGAGTTGRSGGAREKGEG